MKTVAAFKRAMRPGTPVRIVNHLRPVASRDTTVHEKTNTVDLVTCGTDKHDQSVPSYMGWPKAANYRADETDPNTAHVALEGKPFLTITILEV